MSAQNDRSAGPVRAVGALVRLTLADLLRTQRAILAGVVLLAPVAFTVYWSLAERITGDAIYQWGQIFVVGYVNFVIPFLALIVGATLISAEHESQTLVYLLTRPVPRWKTALVKYLTAAALCFAGVLVSMALAFAALALHFGFGRFLANQPPPMVEAFPYWVRLAGVGAAATLVYLAIFLFAGVVVRRPMVFGIGFIVVWEGLVALMKGIIRYATVIHYVRSLAIGATENTAILPSIITVEPVPVWVAAVVLAALTGVFLSLALGWFSRAEYPTSPDR